MHDRIANRLRLIETTRRRDFGHDGDRDLLARYEEVADVMGHVRILACFVGNRSIRQRGAELRVHLLRLHPTDNLLARLGGQKLMVVDFGKQRHQVGRVDIVVLRRCRRCGKHLAAQMHRLKTQLIHERLNLVQSNNVDQHVGRSIVRLGDHQPRQPLDCHILRESLLLERSRASDNIVRFNRHLLAQR
ncbi:hypothetical protein D3C71_1382410 [compost metagenome]